MKMKAFSCPPQELAARLPGWRRPKPAMRTGINPFTQQPMLMPVRDGNDAPFAPAALASFADAPGREVAWAPRTVATLAAFFDGETDVTAGVATLVGPGGQRLFDVAPDVLARLREVTEPPRDFGERVARFASDAGHAAEHGEEMQLSPLEHAGLPLEAIRARTLPHIEELEPHYRDQWQKRFDHWHVWIEELVAFAKEIEAGHGAYCIVWKDPD